jgi:hypothetical protein
MHDSNLQLLLTVPDLTMTVIGNSRAIISDAASTYLGEFQLVIDKQLVM